MTSSRQALAAGLVGLLIGACAGSGDKVPITTSSEEALKLFLQGRDLNEKLQNAESRELFETAVARDPDFAQAYFYLVLTAPTAKDLFEALERAVSLADQASEGERHMILGFEAGVNGDPALQLEHYTALVEAFPDDERAHTFLGTYYFGRQEYDQAIEHYLRATEINPKFTSPWNQLGYAYRYTGSYEKAEEAFRKYIDLIPDEPNPYDSYAELLMKMGRFEESIQQYRRALQIDRDFVPSFVGIGNDYVFLGRGHDARRMYQKLYDIARNDGERRQALFWMAASYVHEGKHERALEFVRRQFAIARKAADGASMAGDLNLMGGIYLDFGDAETALSMYEESIEVMDKADVPPQIKEAARRQHLADRCRVALHRGDLAEAKARADAYREAVTPKQIPFEVRQAHELAGLIALEEKDHRTAVAELSAANQRDPRVLYNLARAYDLAGDAQRARELAERAANFNALDLNYAYVRGRAKKMLANL